MPLGHVKIYLAAGAAALYVNEMAFDSFGPIVTV
jgi:hypothetical protein